MFLYILYPRTKTAPDLYLYVFWGIESCFIFGYKSVEGIKSRRYSPKNVPNMASNSFWRAGLNTGAFVCAYNRNTFCLKMSSDQHLCRVLTHSRVTPGNLWKADGEGRTASSACLLLVYPQKREHDLSYFSSAGSYWWVYCVFPNSWGQLISSWRVYKENKQIIINKASYLFWIGDL